MSPLRGVHLTNKQSHDGAWQSSKGNPTDSNRLLCSSNHECNSQVWHKYLIIMMKQRLVHVHSSLIIVHLFIAIILCTCRMSTIHNVHMSLSTCSPTLCVSFGHTATYTCTCTCVVLVVVSVGMSWRSIGQCLLCWVCTLYLCACTSTCTCWYWIAKKIIYYTCWYWIDNNIIYYTWLYF